MAETFLFCSTKGKITSDFLIINLHSSTFIFLYVLAHKCILKFYKNIQIFLINLFLIALKRFDVEKYFYSLPRYTVQKDYEFQLCSAYPAVYSLAPNFYREIFWVLLKFRENNSLCIVKLKVCTTPRVLITHQTKNNSSS